MENVGAAALKVRERFFTPKFKEKLRWLLNEVLGGHLYGIHHPNISIALAGGREVQEGETFMAYNLRRKPENMTIKYSVLDNFDGYIEKEDYAVVVLGEGLEAFSIKNGQLLIMKRPSEHTKEMVRGNIVAILNGEWQQLMAVEKVEGENVHLIATDGKAEVKDGQIINPSCKKIVGMDAIVGRMKVKYKVLKKSAPLKKKRGTPYSDLGQKNISNIVFIQKILQKWLVCVYIGINTITILYE